MTISIVNRLQVPAYLQSPAEAVFVDTDGTVLMTSVVECIYSECSECGLFAECGRELRRVIEIAPGEAYEYVWDGEVREVIAHGCGDLACYERVAAPSVPALARIEFSRGFFVTASLGADDEFLAPPLETAQEMLNSGADPVRLELR